MLIEKILFLLFTFAMVTFAIRGVIALFEDFFL